MEIIIKLSEILNMMKGFTAGYTSNVGDKMMVDFNGKRYVLEVHEVKNPDKDMFEDLKKINWI